MKITFEYAGVILSLFNKLMLIGCGIRVDIGEGEEDGLGLIRGDISNKEEIWMHCTALLCRCVLLFCSLCTQLSMRYLPTRVACHEMTRMSEGRVRFRG